MRIFTPAEYRQIRDEPGSLTVFAQEVAVSEDTEAARNLDTMVVSSLASLLLDRHWDSLVAFTTSLLHALLAFDRASEQGWGEGRQIAAGWEAFLRLSEACLAMARDEKALEFAKASEIYEQILIALKNREPIASGDLAIELEKSAQRISNVLGEMEEHGLVSRHCVGRRTLVWLGPAGHYFLQHEAVSQPFPVASPEDFEKCWAGEDGSGGAQANPLPSFRNSQLGCAGQMPEPIGKNGV